VTATVPRGRKLVVDGFITGWASPVSVVDFPLACACHDLLNSLLEELRDYPDATVAVRSSSRLVRTHSCVIFDRDDSGRCDPSSPQRLDTRGGVRMRGAICAHSWATSINRPD
jgi:hypothetical protein